MYQFLLKFRRKKQLIIFVAFTSILLVLLLAILNNCRYRKEGKVIKSQIDVDAYYKSIESNVNKCINDTSYRPRVLCLILIHQKTPYAKVKTLSETWANKCDRTLFVVGKTRGYVNHFTKQELDHLKTNYPNESIVFLDIQCEHINELSSKMFATVKYIYDNLLQDFDWLLKADDDTYVITDNLRRFIRHKCPNETYMYGRHFRLHLRLGFVSGGSGYLVSREAIRRLGVELSKNASFCIKFIGGEDVDLAKCLAEVNVYPGDSRDELKRERFHPEPIEKLWNEKIDWLSEYQFREPLIGPDCCSDTSIGFHRLSDLNLFYFFLYKLKRNSSINQLE